MNTKFLLSSDNNNRNELLKKKIIHYYIANGDATIADLGREMDLSIPTVTKLVAELQDDGYILDFGKQETNGGRKPNIYGLNPASGYFVGVDMLKDKLNIAAIDFKGDKVQLEENIPYQLENTPASLEQFCKIIDDFIVSLPVERNKILAIGVNITGRVNPASGYSYSIFYFEEKPLAQILEERLQTKVFIENDSRAMTYGEYMKGVVQGEKNILFVNMAWGLGLGIIIDGNILTGANGAAGEIGHIVVNEQEIEACNCGHYGCIEQYASATGIVRMAKRALAGTSEDSKLRTFGEAVSAKDVFDCARAGDKVACDVVDQVCGMLGATLAKIGCVVNPDAFIIGGGVSRAGQILIDALQEPFKAQVFHACKDTPIVLATLGNDAGIYGAVRMLLS